ncbi:MAG: hypothetical protein KDD63_06220, partial [Bacteroidetes bacterium]|nr:hypothetical protein [Bacteroidota bacterium]
MGKLKTNKLPCAELTVLPDSGKVKEGVNMTFKFCFHSKSIFTEEEMERFDLIITPDTLGL